MKRIPMLAKYFFAFTLFLAIPLIIAGLIFNYEIIQYSENEISKSLILNLQTIKNMNDIIVDSIQKDTIRLSASRVFDKVQGMNDFYFLKNNVNDIIEINKLATVICDTANSNSRLYSVYFYLDNANYIITSNHGVVTNNEFYDTDWITGYNEKKWEKSSIIWMGNRVIKTGNSASGNINVITYLFPLNALSLRQDGVIVVNISEVGLCNTINNLGYASDGSVGIIDSTGKVITHVDKTKVGQNISNEAYVKEIMDSEQTSGYMINSVKGNREIIAYYKTKLNGWIYVGIFPLDYLMNKAYGLRVQMILIIGVIMLLGIVFSYYLSRRLYNPINALVQNVKTRKGFDLKDHENEMTLLSRAFTAISQQEDLLNDIVEKNKKSLEEKYLASLLKDGVETFEDRSMGLVDFRFDFYLCAIISIDQYGKFKEKYPQDQNHIMKMLILKVAEEILNQKHICRGVLYDANKIVIIINSDKTEREQAADDLKSALETIQKEISKILDHTITIAQGNYYSNKSQIPSSFNEALEALKRRLVFGHGRILNLDESQDENNKYYYPYTLEKHIFNNLSLGVKEDTLMAVHVLVGDIKNRTYLSPDNILQIFMQIVGNTVKYMLDKNINVSDVFGNDYNVYQKISMKETVEEIEIWLKGFYTGIIEYIKSPLNGNLSHADCVFEYIRKNFLKNIDITAIADNVGISYSYVRKIVKQKTGKSVVDYINGLRIEEAKRLLRQTNMNIAEIANQAGYNNDQSFNRFFKKYEGITPGEFRNLD